MTSPPQNITVQCPQCGMHYEDWWRPSMNLMIEHFDDDYLREASTSTCPACQYTVEHGVLIVREDGVWEIGVEGDDAT